MSTKAQVETQPVLLTWNPKRFEWRGLDKDIAQVESGRAVSSSWSTGVTKTIAPGTAFYMMRVGVEPRGIIGSGVTTGAVYRDASWDKSATRGRKANFVPIRFEVLSQDPLVPMAELRESPFADYNWSPRASGVRVPADIALALRERIMSDAPSAAGGHREGAPTTVELDVWERSGPAREMALLIHGRACAVCGVDMRERYGDAGRSCIHVHHLVPLSSIGASHEVDPEKDLRPVCPNCHSVIHARTPPYAIFEVRDMLAAGELGDA